MPNSLRCDKLSLSINEKQILTDINCTLSVGQSIALIGPNGAGKSTLLKTLGGLVNDEQVASSVFVGDQPIYSLSPQKRAKQVAYVPGHFNNELPLTVFDSVITALLVQSDFRLSPPSAREKSQCTDAMRLFQCDHLKLQPLNTLSTGEKQLVALARAWLQGARLLLLDESLSGIDLNHLATVRNILKQAAVSERIGFILVSHDINYALSVCDESYLMKAGRIIRQLKTKDLSKDDLVMLYDHPALEFIAGPKVFA